MNEPRGMSREDRYARAFRLRDDWLARRRAGAVELFDAFLAANEDVRDLLEAMLTDGATPVDASAGARASDADGRDEWIGPYRLVSPLGRGGMGTVYLAERPDRGQRVAIKVMQHVLASPSFAARFDAECRALARMNHDSIARCYDSGTTRRGEPYLVMELVDGGRPLTEWCDARSLPIRERIELFLAICDGVQHAHLKGVVHRDLKPQNVLVAEVDGRSVVKVIDFGIAVAVEARAESAERAEGGGHEPHASSPLERERPVGTWEYMSPEQARGEVREIDLRTDVYSLGVMLYQLLSGTLPFAGGSLRGLRTQAVQELLRDATPPTPSTRALEASDAATTSAARGTTPVRLSRRLRGDLDWIVGKAMAKSPEQRYASARELAEDLRRHLTGRPVVAAEGMAGLGYRAAKALGRHRAAFASVFAVLLTMVVGTVLVLRYADVATVRAAENERLAADAAATAGFAHARQGEWDKALDRFDLALRHGHSDHVLLELGRYDALEGLGRFDEAVEVAERLAATGRDGPHTARVALLVGATALDQDRDAATASLERALELDRSGASPLAPADREYTAALLAMDLPSIESHLRAALAQDPRHLRALDLLGPTLAFRGDASAMLRLADDYAKLYPSAQQPLWARVFAQGVLGRYDDAHAAVEEIRRGPVREAADLLDAIVDGIEAVDDKLDRRVRTTVPGLMGALSRDCRRIPPPPITVAIAPEPDLLEQVKQMLPLVMRMIGSIGKIQVAMDGGGFRLRLHPWFREHYDLANLQLTSRKILGDQGVRPGEGIPEALLLVASGFKTGIGLREDELMGLTAGIEVVHRAHVQLTITLALGGVRPGVAEPAIEKAIAAALALHLSEEELLCYACFAASTVVADPLLADGVMWRWRELHGRTEWWRLLRAELLLVRGDHERAAAELGDGPFARENVRWADDLRRRLRP